MLVKEQVYNWQTGTYKVAQTYFLIALLYHYILLKMRNIEYAFAILINFFSRTSLLYYTHAHLKYLSGLLSGRQ